MQFQVTSLSDLIFKEVGTLVEMDQNNETLIAEVSVQSNDQPFDAAEIHLTFDPAEVQVQSIEGSSRLPVGLLSNFDNEKGTIDFAAGTLSDLPRGDVSILRMEFAVKGRSGQAALRFVDQGIGSSVITYAGNIILSGTSDGEIDLTPCGTCGLTVYPNASDGRFNFSLPDHAGSSVRIRLTGSDGKVILETDMELDPNRNLIDISEQPAGIYLFQIETESGIFMKKILKY